MALLLGMYYKNDFVNGIRAAILVHKNEIKLLGRQRKPTQSSFCCRHIRNISSKNDDDSSFRRNGIIAYT